MTIDQKIQQLRVEWKNNPSKRDIIERRVKSLKNAQEYAPPVIVTAKDFRKPTSSELFERSVIDNLVQYQ